MGISPLFIAILGIMAMIAVAIRYDLQYDDFWNSLSNRQPIKRQQATGYKIQALILLLCVLAFFVARFI